MSTQSIDLHTRLRAATAPLHNHLNQQPMLAALLGHDIPLADYQSLLGTYYCFKFHMQTYSFECRFPLIGLATCNWNPD